MKMSEELISFKKKLTLHVEFAFLVFSQLSQSASWDFFQAKGQCWIECKELQIRSMNPTAKYTQMCHMAGDETIEHMIQECDQYGREKMEMMQVIMTSMGCEINVAERAGCWGVVFRTIMKQHRCL